MSLDLEDDRIDVLVDFKDERADLGGLEVSFLGIGHLLTFSLRTYLTKRLESYGEDREEKKESFFFLLAYRAASKLLS